MGELQNSMSCVCAPLCTRQVARIQTSSQIYQTNHFDCLTPTHPNIHTFNHICSLHYSFNESHCHPPPVNVSSHFHSLICCILWLKCEWVNRTESWHLEMKELDSASPDGTQAEKEKPKQTADGDLITFRTELVVTWKKIKQNYGPFNCSRCLTDFVVVVACCHWFHEQIHLSECEAQIHVHISTLKTETNTLRKCLDGFCLW